MDKIAQLTGSFTRPSNTTAYTAEDEVNTLAGQALTLEPADGKYDVVTNGSYYIKSLRFVKSSTTTTNASFRIYFYNASYTAIADNSASTLLFADRAKRIGYADVTFSTGGSGSDCAEAYVTGIDLPHLSSLDTLYWRVVAKAAYTPASAEEFYLEVNLF